MTKPPPQRLWLESTLAFVLAFNVTYFIQELFLVVPKALTPGLEPTLFHNNHGWRGTNPLVELLQGSGALATIISSMACHLWLVYRTPRGRATRLLVVWMALLGYLMALSQVIIGAFVEQNDVGRAMAALGCPPGTRRAAAVIALCLMIVACQRLTSYLLGAGSDTGTQRQRTRMGLLLGTWPALIALPLIVPYRIPNALIEVLLPPGVLAIFSAFWIPICARATLPAGPPAQPQPVVGLIAALLALLAFFQLVLRPGVDFF